jgi:hypothetical protein
VFRGVFFPPSVRPSLCCGGGGQGGGIISYSVNKFEQFK